MDDGVTAKKTKVVIWLVVRTGLDNHSGFIWNVLVCPPFQEVNGTVVHVSLGKNAKSAVLYVMMHDNF